MSVPGIGGDGEFSEGRRKLSLRVGIDAEFVWPRRFWMNAWPVQSAPDRDECRPRTCLPTMVDELAADYESSHQSRLLGSKVLG